MSAPQQPWGPHPPPWGPPQPFPGAGRPSSGRGSTPLLVLGLVTAVLALGGTVLPSERFPGNSGSYGLLLQDLGGEVRFLAAGLVPLIGVVLLVVGALLQRSRAAGTGLLLVGAGVVTLEGLQLLFALVQSSVGPESSPSLAVGGVLLGLAGCTAIATAVVGLVRLTRPR